MSVSSRIRRALKRPIGWWSGPGFAKHPCKPPVMPRRVPAGLIYRCECGSEWRWMPAKAGRPA